MVKFVLAALIGDHASSAVKNVAVAKLERWQVHGQSLLLQFR